MLVKILLLCDPEWLAIMLHTLPLKALTETTPLFASSESDYQQAHPDELLRTWELLGNYISMHFMPCLPVPTVYLPLYNKSHLSTVRAHMLDLSQYTNNLVGGSTDRLVSYRTQDTLLNQSLPSLFANSSWFFGLLSSAGNEVTETTPGAPMEDG